jgi:hypothetical protein
VGHFNLGGDIAALARSQSRRNTRRDLWEQANFVVEHNLDALTRRRAQLVRNDAYGKPILDRWSKEVDGFIHSHIVARLTAKETRLFASLKDEVRSLIAERT